MIDNSIRPLLSIIVPAYNAERTIERCISSILNQAFKQFEIIIIDDGSVDQTQRIIQEWYKQAPEKIRYFKSEVRGGPGGARNKGMAIAQGDYIGFVDSDDWVDSSLFSEVIKQAEMNKADIAIFGVKNEYENSCASQIRYEYYYPNSIDHKYALRLLCRSNNNDTYISPMVCQKVFKREFLIKNHLLFEPDCWFEDDYFTFRCLLNNCCVIFVPKVYYHYYQNPDSITHTFSKKHIDDLINVFSRLRLELKEVALFETYHLEYFSYFDKCIASTLERLFSAERDTRVCKKYISYLLNGLYSALPISEWIDYFDIQRIRRFFNYDSLHKMK